MVTAWAKPKRRAAPAAPMWVPAAKDQEPPERYEAAAVGHALGEGGEQTHREVHATERRQHAREPDAEVTHPGDAHTGGIHRFRHLAGRPQAKAERGAEEDEDT